MKQESRHENLIYLALWGVLFAAPLLSMYVRYKSGDMEVFRWHEVTHVWQQFAFFLVLFLLHNFLLAPLVVYRQRIRLYLGSLVALIAMVILFQCATQPADLHQRRGPADGRHPEMADGRRPPHFGDEGRPDFGDKRPLRRHRGRPVILDWHDVFSLIMLILMLGMNLGIKFYFKSRDDQKRLIRLEKENLEQQLEYLKYQINPHFFMNTLNNIHALVDIDPEKAKQTILELSRMMRFILYEGDKHGVPLSREFDFIRTYITLMRLRYTERVSISVDLPREAPDRQIPPLMLITFIENAFKHGISYQQASFVDIKATVDGEQLLFQCRNSKADRPNPEKGGVGLANVRQRLNLLYDSRYTLDIHDEPATYSVILQIPLTKNQENP